MTQVILPLTSDSDKVCDHAWPNSQKVPMAVVRHHPGITRLSFHQRLNVEREQKLHRSNGSLALAEKCCDMASMLIAAAACSSTSICRGLSLRERHL
jgi:hypothetical protein